MNVPIGFYNDVYCVNTFYSKENALTFHFKDCSWESIIGLVGTLGGPKCFPYFFFNNRQKLKKKNLTKLFMYTFIIEIKVNRNIKIMYTPNIICFFIYLIHCKSLISISSVNILYIY